MDFTNGFYKAENPVVLEEVKTFLQSMERRGATVKDLDDAIVQLNNVSHSKSFKEPCVGQCYMPKESLFDIWVEKLVALCIATGREVPKFITDKAGECW